MSLAQTQNDIRAIARAARFDSEAAWTWRGETMGPHRGRLNFPVPEGQPPIVAALAQQIYEGYYIRPDEVRLFPMSDRTAWLDGTRLLEAANDTKRSWSPGWETRGEVDGRQILARGGDVIEAEPAHVKPHGGAFAVLLPGSVGGAQTGWFHARGEHEHPAETPRSARIYWNVGRHGAGLLLHEITRALNAAKVPFHFKLLDDPPRYARADAAVLYLGRDDVPRAAPVIRAVHARVLPYMKLQTPAFTKRMLS